MTEKKRKHLFGALLILYFLFFGVLLAVGSFYDLDIEENLFDPQNAFARFFEIWGEAPRFAMWAPAATVLLFCRHSLAECIEVIHRIFPFIPKISAKTIKRKRYKLCNFVLNIVEIVGFTALAVLGWDKLIRNVGKYYVDLSRGVWYAIAAVVTLIVFALFTKIPKSVLNRLEPLALAGIVFGLLYILQPAIKGIFNRARFREMVAFSVGIKDAKDASVSRALLSRADLSYFTPWYKSGMGGTVLNGLKLSGTSCPSGHMMSGCFIFLITLLTETFDRTKKFTLPAALFSFLYVGVLGLTRIIRGAHFLSDISLGAIFGMLFFLIAAGLLKSFYRHAYLPVRDYV